jgi:hypothetical protein
MYRLNDCGSKVEGNLSYVWRITWEMCNDRQTMLDKGKD